MGTIGERVRETRKRRKLTQEALAKAAGVSKNAISKIEKGRTKRPNPETLYAIADKLGVSDRWIINGGADASTIREDSKPYGLSAEEWAIVQSLRMLTPTQRKKTWADIQDAERQNLEVIESLNRGKKAG